MNIRRLVAGLSFAIVLVTLAAALTPRTAEACSPGQVCPPVPNPGDKRRRIPTATPIPTAKPTTIAGVVPLPIPPASGSNAGIAPNGGNPGSISTNPSSGPARGTGPINPWGFGLIIVVCIGLLFLGGRRFFRGRGALGSIGGSGGLGQLGNENFTVTRPIGAETGTIEMNTIGGHNLGGGRETGTIEMNTIGGHDLGGGPEMNTIGGSEMNTIGGKDIGEIGGNL